MNVSAKQLQITATNEGFVAKAYKDGFVGGVQSYSIGYGHQIQSNEQDLFSATLSKAQALAILQTDSQNVVNYINANTKTRVPNQNQFDAFFDYGYNAGVGALQANILNLWNSGASAADVATAIQTTRTKYHDTNGDLVVNQTLVQRRLQEAATFASPYLGGLIILLIVGVFTYFYWETRDLDPVVQYAEKIEKEVGQLFV